MKAGDLVKMKRAMFWYLKNNPRVNYTEDIGTIITSGSHVMEVVWPTGRIDQRDKDTFDVISEE